MATADTTEPTAAPTTVPSAPNADPATAVVAAAPAPATTLEMVRLDFDMAAAGGFGGGWLRKDELTTHLYRMNMGAVLAPPWVVAHHRRYDGL